MNKIYQQLNTIGLLSLFFIGFSNFMWLTLNRPTWPGTLPQMIRVGYNVNPNFTPKNNITQAQQLVAIQNAANIWFEQGFSNFQFEYDGQTPSIDPIPNCSTWVGRANSVYAETVPNPDIPTRVLAVADIYDCNTTAIRHFEMRFNDRDFTWTQQMIQEVAAHEFGHALGLGHCGTGETSTVCSANRPGTDPVAGMMMNKFYIQGTNRLHPDDIAGIRALYGVRGAVPFEGNLVAIKKTQTGTNSTEVHVLRRTAEYQEYSIQTGTILHETGANFDFAVWDVNRDGIMDIVAIKKAGTGTNSTEVHVLNGATNYKTYLLSSSTALQETGFGNSNWEFTVWDYDGNGIMDLVAIAKSGTASGKTEVHVLNGSDNFQTYLLHSVTAVEPNTDSFDFSVWDYNADGKMDLVAVKKNITGAGKTEVHVVDGANDFKTYLLHSITPIEENTSNYEFIPTFYPVRGSGMNLVAIKKFYTGSNSTELHVLNGATNFATYLISTATILIETGSNYDMDFWL